MSPEGIGYIWIYDEGLFHQANKCITVLKVSNHGLRIGSKPNTQYITEGGFHERLHNSEQTDVQIFPKEFFICV